MFGVTSMRTLFLNGFLHIDYRDFIGSTDEKVIVTINHVDDVPVFEAHARERQETGMITVLDYSRVSLASLVFRESPREFYNGRLMLVMRRVNDYTILGDANSRVTRAKVLPCVIYPFNAEDFRRPADKEPIS